MVTFANWNWVRILRLVIGVGGLAQGVMEGNAVLSVIGATLIFQGAFNVGCCGTSCAAPAPAKRPANHGPEEIQFEEIK